MPTIKDIAREAGCSCGTVSNVLNKRGNVKAEKIRRVEDAVARLGYEVNESAKTLRKQVKHTIGLLVPNMRSRHYIEVYETLCASLAAFDYNVEIYSTNNLFEHEKNHIRRMISSNVMGIVAFPTYIDSGELYSKIPESIFLTIVGPRPEDVTRPYLNVSFDYEHIANDISSHIIKNHYKNAVVFIDSVRFSKTFKLIITQRLTKAGINVSNYGSTGRTSIARAFEMLDKNSGIDVVVTSNITRAQAVHHTYSCFMPEHMPEIITLSASNTIFEDEYTCVFLDYHKLGNIVADVLINAIIKKKEITTSFTLNSEGLNKKQLNLPFFASHPRLSILAVEDSCTTMLTKLLPQFERRTGIKVDLSFYPKRMQYQTIGDAADSSYDILIADYNHIECQPEGRFLARRDAPELWERLHTCVDLGQTYFPKVGYRHLCMSFNTSCQMLFYRKDWMREQHIKRAYYERFYQELHIPDTLEEFDGTARFFSQDFHEAPGQLYGVSLSSFQSEDFLGEFFGRLQAAGLSIFNSDGELELCREDLMEEILRYFKLLQISNVKNSKLACSGIDEFVRGSSVMSILSTANTHIFNNDQYGPIVDCMGCHDVPGHKPIVEANIIGIVPSSSHQEEALSFLHWVFHDSISNILTLLSGQPICRASTRNTEVLELYPWLKYFNRNVADGGLISEFFSGLASSPDFRWELITALMNAYIDPTQLEPALQRVQTRFRGKG